MTKIQLENIYFSYNHFLPLAKTSSRVAPLSPSYESYTKKEREAKPWMNVNEKMVMVFDNKNIV